MRLKAIALAIPLAAGVLLSPPSYAASEAECAIWLCAPSGFPGAAGCAFALAAMIDRIKSFEPPLPPFGSCSQDGSNDGNTYRHGVAAFIPAHRTCRRYTDYYNRTVCDDWKTMPDQHVHGASCRRDEERAMWEPRGCTRTDHYVQTFQHGRPMGDVFYFNLWR